MHDETESSGLNKHHDQIFGDFDGDGQVELVFWNQGANKLFLADIPSNPKTAQPWPYTEIYSGSGEGLAKGDIDGNGKIDLLAGGHWFKHNGGMSYTPCTIGESQREARIAVGDLKAGGNLEVVLVLGDDIGPLKWYESTGDPRVSSSWVGHDLWGFDVDHGHSLEVGDFNLDGKLDIFCGETRLNDGNADGKIWIFLGDGNGNFTKTEVAAGIGVHEGRVGDLDGDGDLDILGKPFEWHAPRLDFWLNNAQSGGQLPLDRWQ